MNLRSAYFPDWTGGPTVLFWGTAKGLHDLRDLLRASRGESYAIGAVCEAVDHRKIFISIVSDRRETGMYVRGDRIEWRLRRDDAEDFAAKLDSLASSSVAAHQYLDAYGGGIAVEASLNEYPDSLRP